jgi:hypothetical protein
MNNAVFWDVTPCGSGKNRSFGRNYPRHHCENNHLPRNNGSREVTNVRSSLILVPLNKEASFLTSTTRHQILEDDIRYPCNQTIYLPSIVNAYPTQNII